MLQEIQKKLGSSVDEVMFPLVPEIVSEDDNLADSCGSPTLIEIC